MAGKDKNELSFEKAFDKLETLVQQLEDGSLGLEEAMKAFEEGMGLVKSCQMQLGKAESRLKELVKNQDDEWALKDID